MSIKEADILKAHYPDGGIHKSIYCDHQKLKSFWSPDKKHKLIFSHSVEFSMGTCSWCVTLATKHKILHPFPPSFIGKPYCAWSFDSRFFAVQISSTLPVILVWNCDKDCFAVINLQAPEGEMKFLKNGDLVYEINDYGLNESSEILNNVYTWEKENGKPEWPLIRYKKNSIKFKRSQLKFYPADEISNIKKIIKVQKQYQLNVAENGFLPFKSEAPQSTDHKINGKRLKIFQLEAFAKYGDHVCQKWLKAVRKKQDERTAQGGNRSDHHTVVKYIGEQKR
jgi:hypothetical protein